MDENQAVHILTLAALAGILGIGVWYRIGLPGDVPQAVASTFMFTFLAGGVILALDTIRLGLQKLRRGGGQQKPLEITDK